MLLNKTVLYYINICLFLKLMKNIQYSRYMWLEQNEPAIQGEAQKDYLTVGLKPTNYILKLCLILLFILYFTRYL